MTGLAIVEAWNMASTGPREGRLWGAWRDVVMAWAVGMVLAGALLLAVPSHGRQSAPSLWSLSPAAGSHIHKKAFDAEGATGDEACSDRDYANELC
jgi:hypothetical protein